MGLKKVDNCLIHRSVFVLILLLNTKQDAVCMKQKEYFCSL